MYLSDINMVFSSSAAIGQLGEVEQDLSASVHRTPTKSATFLRQSGKSYINRSKRVVGEKIYVPFYCKCSLECSKTFPNSERLSVFKRYWEMGSWNAQTAFLCSSMFPVSWDMNSRSVTVYLRDMDPCTIVNKTSQSQANIPCHRLGCSWIGYVWWRLSGIDRA